MNLTSLTVSIPSSETSWTTLAFTEMDERLRNKRSGLRLDVRCGKNKVVSQGKEIEAIQAKTIDMATISLQDIAARIARFQPLTEAYRVDNFAELTQDYAIWGPYLQQLLAKELGLIVLEMIYIGTRVLAFNQTRSVSSPQDLANIRLRVPIAAAWSEMARSLGTIPCPVDIDGILPAYAAKEIDAHDNPLPTLISNQFASVVEQIVLTNHSIDCLFIVIAEEKWQKLDLRQQAALKESAEQAKRSNDRNRHLEEEKLRWDWAEKIKAPYLEPFREQAKKYNAERKKPPIVIRGFKSGS